MVWCALSDWQKARRAVRWAVLVGAAGGVGLLALYRQAARFETPGRAMVYPLLSGRELQTRAAVGEVVDMWRGVVVRANGEPYHRSHGRHYALDGYYYGRMWQCVEFVKRFYYDHYGHAFPDGMGHAKSFFDPEIPHGGWNARRGLWQFTNGYGEAPRPGDLVVWTDGDFGHVAIICRVETDFVEVIQQNVAAGSRMRLLRKKADGELLGSSDGPSGFLRRESGQGFRPPGDCDLD